MNNVQFEIMPDGEVRLKGDLTFATVQSLLSKTDTIINGQAFVKLDLQAIKRADSAGLALLLYWMKKAKQKQIHFAVLNMPLQLTKVAKVCELNVLFSKQ